MLHPTPSKVVIFAAVCMLGIYTSSAKASSVTIGTSDSGNCSLGGCLSGDFVYEQLYASSAFPGEINFTEISFFDQLDPATQLSDVAAPSLNGSFESGNFDISFATTNEALDSTYPIDDLHNVRSFFVGSLGGPFLDGVYTITGSDYNYNPSNGNLVLIMNCKECGATNLSWLNNYVGAYYGLGPSLVSRAAYQVGEGTVHDLTGLVTEFSGGVPEPSTWALTLLGSAGLGLGGYRRAKKGQTANAAA